MTHAQRAAEIATSECFCEPLDGICRNERGLCKEATERNVARIAAALADVEREAEIRVLERVAEYCMQDEDALSLCDSVADALGHIGSKLLADAREIRAAFGETGEP